MQSLDDLKKRMTSFSEAVNSKKELRCHSNNKFNKQYGVLLKDWHYLDIITRRIEEANPERDSTQLGLDLKTLYVFGRVYSESLLFIASLFIESSNAIDWSKIGPFIKSAESNLNNEAESFKNFWVESQGSIKGLFETFRYRNYVLHEKNSTTEWTMAHTGRSNLDHVSIANVPWREDGGKKEVRTLNARDLMGNLYTQTSHIFDYLESVG